VRVSDPIKPRRQPQHFVRAIIVIPHKMNGAIESDELARASWSASTKKRRCAGSPTIFYSASDSRIAGALPTQGRYASAVAGGFCEKQNVVIS